MKKVKITFEILGSHEVYAFRVYDPDFDEWFLDTAYHFVRKENDTKIDAEYLNYRIVSKLLEYIRMGYEIIDDR